MASTKHLTGQLEQGGGGVQDVLDGGVHLGRDGVNAPDLLITNSYLPT